ncbi:F0F1 ATP synthase subunit B family protein [Sedimentitalea nanhaiensis]|uniref:ATP synthase subunit b n=1 Tax=Sedimentitalea nanhaiensis TaxID=999627 RepID=A0A1I7BWL3_9RHOB|nr:ATP synthase subunit B [Sedimentitalea nanhaiensis]SFT91582.1 ATP synthase F0 subcomplex B subunit [Sedimentitalea nanhaiensis]
MSIDWFTVIAQIVNFLVLVWLLKRFLYRPILDGIDARENEIAERMNDATMVRRTAEAAEAEFRAEIESLRSSRGDLLKEAHQQAEAERDALLAEARKQLERDLAARQAQNATEARRYTADLHRAGAEALLALTRKALLDLADESFEHRIAAHAVTRLAAANDDLKKAAGDNREAVVLTRDPLPSDVRAQLERDLAAVLPDVTVRFDTEPALAPGLTLRLGGAQVAWTVDSYLDGLDAVLADRARQARAQGFTDAA